MQKSISEESNGKINVTTDATALPTNIVIDAGSVRVMPVQRQILALARIKGELEARGYKNVEEKLKIAVFSTYDATVKKITGVTAFTTRVDSSGNEIGGTATSHTLASLVSSIFVDFADGVRNSTLSDNPITNFLHSMFSSNKDATRENLESTGVVRVDDGIVPASLGSTAGEILKEAITLPIKAIGNFFKSIFGL